MNAAHHWSCQCGTCKPAHVSTPAKRMLFMVGDSLMLGAKSWSQACLDAQKITGRAVSPDDVRPL